MTTTRHTPRRRTREPAERVAMNRSTRALWLAVTVLASLGVGAVAAFLTWAEHGNGYSAAMAGGAASGGCLLTLLAALHFTTGGPRADS